MHALSLPSLCLSSCQAPGAKVSLALAGQRRRLGPHQFLHLTPVLPKHCHRDPGQTRAAHSLMMRHPGGVAIGAQPARDTPHLIARCLPGTCLPCLDLPCPPAVPKPPKTPQSSTTLNRGPQLGTDTSLLYHLLRVRLVALPFLTPPIPHHN